MKRTYGNEPTKLTLSYLAKIAYYNTDPLDIIEIQDWDGNVTGYEMKGCLQGTNMTAEDVNEALEAELVFKINPKYIDRFGDQATEETELDIYELRDLAKGWGMAVEDVVKMCYVA